ncbi:hypothetical protein HDU89_002487 [Geranomyces variabilis]|nr:hypothetical protein HDU89_002487 [Geranomyces variabilis]
MSAKSTSARNVPTDVVDDEEDFVLVPDPAAATEVASDEKASEGQSVVTDTPSDSVIIPTKGDGAKPDDNADGAAESQSDIPVGAEALPRSATLKTAEVPAKAAHGGSARPDTFESFLSSISPLVDDLISKIDANPQYIPTLIEHYQNTLTSRNWGVTILTPDDPAPVGAIGGLATHLPSPLSTARQQEQPARSQPLSSSPTTVRPFVWKSLICDGCEKHRFPGPRYKCNVCNDFDLCEKCYSTPRLVNRHEHNAFEKHIDTSSLWVGSACDGCNKNSFSGTKWVCVECPNYDLCGRCYELRSTLHIPWHTLRPQFLPAVHSKLVKMGFTDKYRNQQLLEDLNGDIERVVAALLADQA